MEGHRDDTGHSCRPGTVCLYLYLINEQIPWGGHAYELTPANPYHGVGCRRTAHPFFRNILYPGGPVSRQRYGVSGLFAHKAEQRFPFQIHTGSIRRISHSPVFHAAPCHHLRSGGPEGYTLLHYGPGMYSAAANSAAGHILTAVHEPYACRKPFKEKGSDYYYRFPGPVFGPFPGAEPPAFPDA